MIALSGRKVLSCTPEFSYTRPGEIEARSMELIRAELGPPLLHPGPAAPGFAGHPRHGGFFLQGEPLFFPRQRGGGPLRPSGPGLPSSPTPTWPWRASASPASRPWAAGPSALWQTPRVAAAARSRGVTRAAVSMEKAAALPGPLILAVGNAPTALIRLCELMEEN